MNELAKTITDDLIEKMESDPTNKFKVVIDFIQIVIDYGVVPGGPISLQANIKNLETNDEINSAIMVADKPEDIQPILEKILATAYLIRK